LSSKPAVVVPVYRNKATPFDRISLAHLGKFLAAYDVFYIGPRDVSPFWKEYEFVVFPDRYFQSRLAYNRLMLDESLYARFSGYSHILIYQLDAAVFRDELLFWCDRPYDYIGATFYSDLIERADGYRWRYAKCACCNGGFSLRRVDAFLRHLRTRDSTLVATARCIARGDLNGASQLLRYRRHLSPTRYQPHESLNEDVYYGVFSKFIRPALRTPSPDVSDRFAFENIPHEVFERAGKAMPFGCHAWYKSDETLTFWRPHLIGDIPRRVDAIGGSSDID